MKTNPNTSLDDRNWTISWIRLLAMLSIITCHIMQYLEYELAWWFNVGVQIFLCMSGYLYGNKPIDTLPFFKKSFTKILVSYYVVFIPFALVSLALNAVSAYELFLGLLMGSVIPGGEHLWFVPTILCCYIITPFLSSWFAKGEKYLFKYLPLLLLTFWVFSVFVPFFNPAWISCYITGYFLAKLEKSHHYKLFIWALLILSVFFNTVQILAEYVFDWSVPYQNIVYNYAHALLGVSLFVVLKRLLKNSKNNAIIKFSDTYSYEIYLVHQFFILGPLTLMALTPSPIANIAIIIPCVFTGGILAKILSQSIHKSIQRIGAICARAQ